MYNKSVYKTLALITQIGISIMVPMFLLLGISIFIKNEFNIDLVLLFVILGILAGFRNSAVLIKNFIEQDKEESKNKSSELINKHKKYVESE